jgi:hypothetical protein
MVALAMHDKGPVKLPPIDRRHVHSTRVPFHEHRSQRHRLSGQSASNEFQTKPGIFGLERNVGSQAPFAHRAIHDTAHRIRTTGKSEWKLHDILDPRRSWGGGRLALLTRTSGSRSNIAGAIETSET